MVPFPHQELSLEALNPFPESVFSYMVFLASLLAVWLFYLLLPRGFRKQYCSANRKRYARRTDARMPAAGYWMPVQSNSMQQMQHETRSTVSMGGVGIPVPVTIDTTRNQPNTHTPLSTGDLTASPPRSGQYGQRSVSNPPSPEHPALKTIPPNKVIAETMARLQGRGIRLVAHGVHCDPKRVWIRLQDETSNNDPSVKEEPCVTWQTEFPRRVPNQSGQVSIVLMRGSLHKIVLKNILYIDVGKKTQALQLAKNIPDATCWSLLTQNGSLDLQANSKLERDALVSCFSMILDDVHEEDWRALYEASPEPSLANSSTVNANVYRGAGI